MSQRQMQVAQYFATLCDVFCLYQVSIGAKKRYPQLDISLFVFWFVASPFVGNTGAIKVVFYALAVIFLRYVVRFYGLVVVPLLVVPFSNGK